MFFSRKFIISGYRAAYNSRGSGMSKISREFIPVNIAVLTVSDSRTRDNDKSGDLLVSRIANVGHLLATREIVKLKDRYIPFFKVSNLLKEEVNKSLSSIK